MPYLSRTQYLDVKLLGLIILVLLVLSLPAAPRDLAAAKYGTTIVAIRTPNEVAVAADSRVTPSDGSPPSDSECKIHRSGNIYFAISGLLKGEGVKYDSAATVRSILKEKGQLSHKLSLLETRIQAEWERLLPVIQQKLPTYYERRIMNKPFWSIVIFGAENAATYMHVRSIQETKPWSSKVAIKSSVDCTAKCETAQVLGSDKSVNSYLARHRPNLRTQDISGIAQGMVQAEVDLRIPEVGGPIDVLRISKDGQAQWKHRKQNCSD